MTTYTHRCRLCDVESPHFPSSELLERFIIRHVHETHPEYEAEIRRYALEGRFLDGDSIMPASEQSGPMILEDDDEND